MVVVEVLVVEVEGWSQGGRASELPHELTGALVHCRERSIWVIS